MGDRANIAMEDEGKRVYFYTHWSGSELPEIVRQALKRGPDRWDDPSYLARIVFCQLIGSDTKSTTGFGIASEPQDNSYPIIVVKTPEKTVTIEADTRESFGRCEPRGEVKSYSFADYIALPEATWATLDSGREG